MIIEKDPLTGKKHLEKNDFIIARQEKEIENQKNKLEELTLKLNDIDILAQEVAEKAYERACEVVTDTVRTETTLEDISTIENMRDRLTGKNSSLSSGQKNFSKNILNRLVDLFPKNQRKSRLPFHRSCYLRQLSRKMRKKLLLWHAPQ